MKRTAIAALIALLPLGAHAEDESRFYGMAGFGAVAVDLGDFEEYYEALADGYRAGSALRSEAQIDDSSPAFGFGFGYWLHPSLAIEGYFRDFGRPGAGVSSTYPANSTSETTEYRASGLGVALIGLVPVRQWLSVYGRVDVVNMRTAYETVNSNSLPGYDNANSGDDVGMQTGFGLGAQYDFRHGISMRVDWQRMEIPLQQRGLSADTVFSSVNMYLVKGL